jgi:DNA-nicking Smr family endonuclease
MSISSLQSRVYRHLTSMTPDENDIPDVVEHPIGPELDLHTFQPREIGSLIPEYFAQCRARGLFRVRLIHGKGSGALRSGVHANLARLPEVEQVIWPADESGGGWGATWVVLNRCGSGVM